MIGGSLILTQAFLLANIVGATYKDQNAALANTLKNASNLFVSNINIGLDKRYAPNTFANLFLTTTDNENAIPDFAYKVVKTPKSNIQVLKINDKSIILSPGSKEDLQILLAVLGQLYINKVDAVLISNPKDQKDNVLALAEMKLFENAILFDNPENIENLNDTNKIERQKEFSSITQALSKQNINIVSLGKDSKLTFAGIQITPYDKEGSTQPVSYNIAIGGKNIFVQNEFIDQNRLNQTIPGEIYAYVVNNGPFSYTLLSEKKAKQVVVAKSQLTEDEQKIKEDLNENAKQLEDNTMANIFKKGDENEIKIDKENVPQEAIDKANELANQPQRPNTNEQNQNAQNNANNEENHQ